MSSWFSTAWEFVLSLFANVDWRAVPAFLGRKLVEGLFQAIAVVVIGWLVLYRQWRQLMQGRSDQVICYLLSIARLIIRGSASYHLASTSRSRSSSLHCKSTGTVIFRRLPHWGYSFLVPLYQQQPDKRVTIVLRFGWVAWLSMPTSRLE
jgi:hypothetical protein